MTTANEVYKKVFDQWGNTSPPYTLEEFALFPEEKQVGLLEGIAHLNPGFWAEKIAERPFDAKKLGPERWGPGRIIIAHIPTVAVETEDGTVQI